MKTKVNIEEVCKKFNTLRQENLRKIFSPSEMEELLVRNGIGKQIFRKMAQNAFFRVRKDPLHKGNCKQYAFLDTPIYKAQFERVYQEMRDYKNSRNSKKGEETVSEESAIKLLKSLGYVLKKPAGLNEAALKREMPKIYEKYLTLVEI